MSESYPEQYLEGIRLFNEEDFFESHEVWEDLWSETMDERKKFYQGLIQTAVALLHFGNGNMGGARKLYFSSRKYLERYPAVYEGLDLARLLDDMQICFQELLDCQEAYPSNIELKDERVPKINFPVESAG